MASCRRAVTSSSARARRPCGVESNPQHHVLDDRVVLDRVHRLVLAVARLLEAAVRHLGDEGEVIVDPDRAELDGLGDAHRPADIGRAMRVAKAIQFGTVWVNDHFTLVSEMPHGGFKESGYGKDQSMYAIEDYTVVKHVMLRV